MKRTFLKLPLRELVPHTIRADFGTIEERQAFGRSYDANPVNLIAVDGKKNIKDGHRRHDGLMQAFGPDHIVTVVQTDEELDDLALLDIQVEADRFTKRLTPVERAVANHTILEKSGITAEALAEKRGCHPSSICRSVSLFKCEKAVIDAASTGQIDESKWYELSSLSPDQQLVLLSAIVKGEIKSRSDLKKARKPRDAVRAGAIKCPLPSGTQVIVKGDELSLDDMIEAMAEAMKLLKAAHGKGLTAKTASKMWAELARNGN